jgi:hypothetical protein
MARMREKLANHPDTQAKVLPDGVGGVGASLPLNGGAGTENHRASQATLPFRAPPLPDARQ